MDVLTDWLQLLVGGGVTLARSHVSRPWGVALDCTHGVVFHHVARGACWLRAAGGPALPLSEGDLVMVMDGRAHALVDDPASPTKPSAIVLAHRDALHPPDANPLATVYSGCFRPDPRMTGRFLPAMPGLLHFAAAELADAPQLAGMLLLMSQEVETPGPGSPLLVRQLADSLLVYVLRTAARRAGHAPGWLAALEDPYLAKAFARIHTNPETQWSVAALAEDAGLSRSAFSKRFTDRMGEPPLAYLTRWRMTLAARLLVASRAPLAMVSHDVGYLSEAAFSRAFKRHHGIAPAGFRRAHVL